MIDRQKPVTLIGFYLLLGYILLQFIWWGNLMMGLNNEIAQLKTEVTLLKSDSTLETEKEEKILVVNLEKKRWMIVGEGSVFILLLLLGSLRIRGLFLKESEMAKQQRNFLLSVTHELKSPLASTRLQLETLLLRTIPPDTQKLLMKQALQDTDRLQALVENILIATQIDKSNFTLHRSRRDLSNYINDLLDRPSLAKDHVLIKKIEQNIWLSIDEIHFASIVLNLIENACKYSEKGSTVVLNLEKQNNKIWLSIADQGVGIKHQDKKKIFEKFFRVGDEQTRTSKGTGLGLFIVKHLTEEHEGIIFVEDNHPRGTVFKLEFKQS